MWLGAQRRVGVCVRRGLRILRRRREVCLRRLPPCRWRSRRSGHATPRRHGRARASINAPFQLLVDNVSDFKLGMAPPAADSLDAITTLVPFLHSMRVENARDEGRRLPPNFLRRPPQHRPPRRHTLVQLVASRRYETKAAHLIFRNCGRGEHSARYEGAVGQA